MEFTIEFYETKEGRCPVHEFLDDLNASDADDFAAVVAGLDRLRHRKNHRAPLSKALSGGLFELRHLGKLNTRILWFFQRGQRIIAVHGIRNKGQSIAPQDFRISRKRMEDWLQHQPT